MRSSNRQPIRHFVRHYFEMIAAMILGMVILGVPADAALGAAGMGSAELQDDAPAMLLLGMTVTMTVPMVAWMRYRGHAWPACGDMTAAMLIPTVGVLALLWGGVLEDVGALMLIEHIVMPASMLVAMLLRRDEYTGATSHHGQQLVA